LAVVMLQPGREEGYVQLLEVRQTPITPLEKPLIMISDEEADKASAKIRSLALADREIFQLAQRAFVSWARSYIEHQASSIFRTVDLDWLDQAKGWGLLELPKMPELKNKNIDRSLGLGVDVDAVAFKDKDREKKRLEELEKWKVDKANQAAAAAAGEGAEHLKRKKNEAWSGKAEQEDMKLARREKKRRRREAEKASTMTEKEKDEQKKLAQMIEQIRRQNAEKAAQEGSDDEFEGFD
jgi:ATP-dependent RNA helicase DDX55/SPB4